MTDPQLASATPAVIPVSGFGCRVVPHRWVWGEAERGAIEATFARESARNPTLFNGRILLTARWSIERGRYTAEAFETDFASLLHWRSIGWPLAGAVNVFGSAVVVCDGGVLLARMAGTTANAGRVYFPAGTPDPQDVVGGELDYDASIARELAEETGLEAPLVEPTEQRFVVLDGPRISLARLYRARAPAEALIEAVRGHIAAEAEPELSGVLLAQSAADIASESAPPFVATLLDYLAEREAVPG